MRYYQAKSAKIPGTDMKEVYRKAMAIFDKIRKKTKRRSHIRSKYFEKQKIFTGLFIEHLHGKLNHRDKLRRIKLVPCALELIQNTKCEPTQRKIPISVQKYYIDLWERQRMVNAFSFKLKRTSEVEKNSLFPPFRT